MPEDRMVRLPRAGVRLRLAAHGPLDGPPVILLHGFPETGSAWDPVATTLAAQGFRVLAPDQRGFGRSDRPRGIEAYSLDRLAEDVLELAASEGIGRFAVVGHDWGGIVAWWLAMRDPAEVSRIAVLNAPHPATLASFARRNPRQALRSWYVLFFQLPFLPEAALRARGCALLVRSMVGTARRGTFSAEDIARCRADWSQPGALTAMLNWYRALRRRGPLPSGRVRLPTLLIWGERDAFLEPGLAETAISLCDDGRLVRLPRATHWLHHEEPSVVSTQLAGFLRDGAEREERAPQPQ
ncbi:alpha/beta fold hydrolase [Arenibaculum pallidiluteum]|uniref:alpha/beta fold hydrolase n=1 Tax=Arenibaculum pallidiluteum TaxID=2812559 RepID=UPI001A96D10A|nr:alpha/beta fold hydrolase [Arenibaculum pallidiluteum]